MKCINKTHMMQLLCILCTAAVFVSGCNINTNKNTLSNPYDAYSYENSYTNKDETTINVEFT
ncbi:MAG: hypothetical protein IJ419_08595, partial [Agathobacter sp.]|nr:hypothetical protein [Agathobacter sp.]